MKEGQKEKKVMFSVEEAQGILSFHISDNGIGMSKHRLNKVRKNISFSSKENGSGLGIQLINRVCEEHNADLIINSAENKGTTISVMFKCKEYSDGNNNSR